MTVKISQLPAGAALTGVEDVPIVQSSTTVRVLMSAIGAYVRGLFTATPLTIAEGGTGAATAVLARAALSAAESGANSDITSLSGLTTALSIAQGGTGAKTAVAALTALGALPVAGGTMTGDLTLKGDPTTDLMAAPKQYVDAAGRILQQIQEILTTNTSGTATYPTTANPTVSGGTQALSVTITPKSASSKLLVKYTGPDVQATVTTTALVGAIFRDDVLVATDFCLSNGHLSPIALLDTSSTAVTTFTFRFGPGAAATMYLNGGSAGVWPGFNNCVLSVTEIAV